jgi:hypothetical protein
MDEPLSLVCLVNEVVQHSLGNLEIGNYPVPERFDRHNIRRRSAQHLFSLIADGLYLSRLSVKGYDRRFINDNAFAIGVNQCVRRAEIDGQVG